MKILRDQHIQVFQNQFLVCVCMHVCYFKEMAYAVIKTDRFQDLHLANQKSRRARVWKLVGMRPKKANISVWGWRPEKTRKVSAQAFRYEEFSLACGQSAVFVYFRLSTDWMRPIYNQMVIPPINTLTDISRVMFDQLSVYLMSSQIYT